MNESTNSQREHNESFRARPMVATLAEALWRLRLSPSGHDLHELLPAEAFVSPVIVDLSAVLADDEGFDLDDIHATLMLPPGYPEVVGAFLPAR